MTQRLIIISLCTITLLFTAPGCRKSTRAAKSSTVKPTKLIKDMNFKEALAAKQYYVENNRPDLALKALERAVAIGTDHEQLKELRLELADRYFEQKDLENAQKHYNEYVTLYPRSEQREKAEYQAIKAAFKSTLDSNKDQSKTYETLELIDKFVESTPASSPYIQKVRKIASKCYKKLCSNDLEVCDLYIKQYKYTKNPASLKAAERRLQHIKKEYANYIDNDQPRLLTLEMQLAQAQNNTELYTQKQKELLALATDSNSILSPKQRQELTKKLNPAITLAQKEKNRSKAKNYATRF